MLATNIINVPEFAMSEGALLFCVNNKGIWQYSSCWKNLAAARRHLTNLKKRGFTNECYICFPADAKTTFNLNIVSC